MCDVYWDEDFPGKIASGEWQEKTKRKDPDALRTFIPFTDRNGNEIVETHQIHYVEVASNEERARLHMYITKEGKIGGSGHPDPKRIRLRSGKSYHLTRPSENEPCAICGWIGHGWPDGVPPRHA
jgi:hypothetical protein